MDESTSVLDSALRAVSRIRHCARRSFAAIAAERKRPSDLDIDRMVAGLGAAAEIDDQQPPHKRQN